MRSSSSKKGVLAEPRLAHNYFDARPDGDGRAAHRHRNIVLPAKAVTREQAWPVERRELAVYEKIGALDLIELYIKT